MNEPDDVEYFARIAEAFAPDRYDCSFNEGQRQLILLALHKLRQVRPAWDKALSEIETQFDGQLDWYDGERHARTSPCSRRIPTL